MDIHDDDPVLFETLLKYIYTREYEKDAVATLASGDSIQELLVLEQIYALADKYEVAIIHELIAQDARPKLLALKKEDVKHLNKIVSSHYDDTTITDSPLGGVIATHIVESCVHFMAEDSCMQLVKTYSSFGADVALASLRDTLSMECYW